MAALQPTWATEDGSIKLYLGDCLEVLPHVGPVDAVVTDPPYGIGEAAGKAKTRTSGLTAKIHNADMYRRDYGDDAWDDEPIPQATLDAVLGAAQWQIIFGGNYYDLPPTSCWLVWDKLNGETDFADCELAWTNLKKAVRRLCYRWNGCMREERHIPRVHPTQKPLGVMKWCLGHLPAGTGVVMDPFMGSGTTGVACVLKGHRFVGIERERKYFDLSVSRIQEQLNSAPLFEPPPKVIQREIFA